MHNSQGGIDMTSHPIESDIGENGHSILSSKRRAKRWMPEEYKGSLYWDKRQKNNIAAKKSRENKRLCENIIKERVFLLEEENERLRKEVSSLKDKFGIPIEQALKIDCKGTNRDDMDIKVARLTQKNRKLIEALRSKTSFMQLEENKCAMETVQDTDTSFANNRTDDIIRKNNAFSESTQSEKCGSDPTLPTAPLYNIHNGRKLDQTVWKANDDIASPSVPPTEKPCYLNPRLAIPNRLTEGDIPSCGGVGRYPMYCYEPMGMYCNPNVYPCGGTMQNTQTTNNYDVCMRPINLSIKKESMACNKSYDINDVPNNQPIDQHELDEVETDTGVVNYSMSSVSREEVPHPAWVRIADESPEVNQTANSIIKCEVVDETEGDVDTIQSTVDTVVRSPVKRVRGDAQVRRENEELKVKIRALSLKIKDMRQSVMET